MLVDDIKSRIAAAMKAGRTVEKEILRLALGEIQTAEARGPAATDESTIAIVRKLVKSIEETQGLTADAAQKATLGEELGVLKSLLPAGPSIDALVAALEPVRDAIRAAGNDGQATGVAMKHLKSTGVAAGGKDVAEAVKKLRA